jgi:hypothetical protein
VQGRAAPEELLAGVAFAFAVLLLLYAVVQLVSQSGIRGISFHARIIVTALGPPLAVLFLGAGAEDVAATPWLPTGANGANAPQLGSFYNSIAAIALPLPGATFVFCVVAWFLGKKRRKQSQPETNATFFLVLFPYLSLALAILAVVRAYLMSVSDPSAHIQQWEVWAWLFGCTAILLLQAVLLAFERGVEPA